MPSTRDIRRRIKSVKNTKQITKAMQMVAASKMRKAQQRATSGDPYAEVLNRVLVNLKNRTDASAHPLLTVREVKRELALVLAPDKGLCGALPTNLMREAAKFDADRTDYVVVGRKAMQFLRRTKRNIVADFSVPEDPAFKDVKVVSKFCMDRFLSGEADKVSVIYTRFVNTLVQNPVTFTLLPISPFELGEKNKPSTTVEESVSFTGYLYEPDPAAVLDAILPYYIHFETFQMLLSAKASEHSARMVAMKNATDNADSLVEDLTLEYNKIRQAAITTELLEITSAQMAVSS